MEFTNNEIKNYLTDRLKKDDNVNCEFFVEDRHVDCNSKCNFEYIEIGQGEQELCIHFYNNSTSIFIFDEEFTFIDDNAKQYYTISDIFDCIVYEGNLRKLSHEQILNVFYELIKLLNGTTSIKVSKKMISKQYEYYPRYNYNIKIVNNLQQNGIYQFDNIFIEVDNY